MIGRTRATLGFDICKVEAEVARLGRKRQYLNQSGTVATTDSALNILFCHQWASPPSILKHEAARTPAAHPYSSLNLGPIIFSVPSIWPTECVSVTKLKASYPIAPVNVVKKLPEKSES